ncbi:hypothetical protein P20652_3726 [Pseudoalteromonas sp. BSi20652]|uniref:hypothetical protein n=1 Tax=Pseudoalteromonas sp. BSi20652 TaxID=388384 RepID=UPI000231917B|nr:hypothetical protein [Pseudoalteromonas sp. BSi20652]GAA61837.1 hypothetical protein P20652_3726 [Pseudoalteromonas sp. BSi20652]
MKYQDIRTTLKTGDIVLFSGKGPVSTGIKFATGSKWSHVGMVFVLPEYDFVCVWESTTLSNIKDLQSGQARQGVQLVPLRERVTKYNGQIAVRQLQGFEADSASLKKLNCFRKDIANRPYEQNKIELIKSAYDGLLGANQECLSSLFCSELVAEAYQRLGLLSELVPSNEHTPADFSQTNKLPLLTGSLGPEIILTL